MMVGLSRIFSLACKPLSWGPSQLVDEGISPERMQLDMRCASFYWCARHIQKGLQGVGLQPENLADRLL
eukprot:1142224-Pelagomonas_calceolata.AAC.1